MLVVIMFSGRNCLWTVDGLRFYLFDVILNLYVEITGYLIDLSLVVLKSTTNLYEVCAKCESVQVTEICSL